MIYRKAEFTQAEYNAVMNAISEGIRACYETPVDDRFMVDEYKRDLLHAREAMKSAVWEQRKAEV